MESQATRCAVFPRGGPPFIRRSAVGPDSNSFSEHRLEDKKFELIGDANVPVLMNGEALQTEIRGLHRYFIIG
jgi:hypothetical protein